MFEIDVDLEDLESEIREGFAEAIQKTYAEAFAELERIAQKETNTSYSAWRKGLKIHDVGGGVMVISIEGKLARAIEDGMEPGVISDMLRSGPRAAYNRSQGQDYIDVPLPASKSQISEVMFHTDSDSLMAAFSKKPSQTKTYKFSDTPTSVREEERVVKRIKQVVEAHDPKTSKTSYISFKRLSLDGADAWPKQPVEGKKILDKLADQIESIFTEQLEKVFS